MEEEIGEKKIYKCCQCGQEFDRGGKKTGPVPKYCGHNCRQKAWRIRVGSYRIAHNKQCPHCREGWVMANDPYDGYCTPRCAESAAQWAEDDGDCPRCGAPWVGQRVCAGCGFLWHKATNRQLGDTG